VVLAVAHPFAAGASSRARPREILARREQITRHPGKYLTTTSLIRGRGLGPTAAQR